MTQKPKMGVVKNLHEDRTKANTELLSSFLKLAKNGKLTDVCIIATVDGEPEIVWNSDNDLALLGGIELAKSQLVMDQLGVFDDDDDDLAPLPGEGEESEDAPDESDEDDADEDETPVAGG